MQPIASRRNVIGGIKLIIDCQDFGFYLVFKRAIQYIKSFIIMHATGEDSEYNKE